MQTIDGKGKVFHNDQLLFEGSYHVEKDIHPDRQTILSATFDTSEKNFGRLAEILKMLQLTLDLVLKTQDGRKFDVTLIANEPDFSSGKVHFEMIFIPGRPTL